MVWWNSRMHSWNGWWWSSLNVEIVVMHQWFSTLVQENAGFGIAWKGWEKDINKSSHFVKFPLWWSIGNLENAYRSRNCKKHKATRRSKKTLLGVAFRPAFPWVIQRPSWKMQSWNFHNIVFYSFHSKIWLNILTFEIVDIWNSLSRQRSWQKKKRKKILSGWSQK